LGASNDTSILAVPGWTTAGNFTTVQYATGLGFPTASDPGPATRGSNFFAGGPNNGSSSASQSVDASNIAAQIDTGTLSFVLSGYLGGFINQGDNATFVANFLSATSNTLGTATIGPVSVADRSSATGLLLRTTAGTIPVGTRSITFNLQMTRLAGDYNDGYADNLSFVASGVPEPGTLGTLAAGFGIVALFAVRRNRQHLRR
jgi:hypothetical protein